MKPVQNKELWLSEKGGQMPRCEYNEAYLASVQSNTALSRSVAVVGHLYHGKTSVVDVCVERTHSVDCKGGARKVRMRYTAPRVDELDRAVSIKATAMSLLLPNSRSKHLAFTLYDAPGGIPTLLMKLWLVCVLVMAACL